MNKIILIGNLTRDPETRVTGSGTSVCSFSIAVNRKYANQQGQRETDFFNISAWRQLGENCAKYLAKGRKVCVTGELQTRTYDDKNGVKRTAIDVVADDVEFLTPRQDGQGGQGGYTANAQHGEAPASSEGFVEVNDELPF